MANRGNSRRNSGLLNDKDHNLWVLLLNTKEAMVAARTKDLSRCGITHMEAGVLSVVQNMEETRCAEATVAEIARWLFRKPNTISTLISRMERKGLVERVSDLGRKNLVRVALTEKGRGIYERSNATPYVKNVFSSLSADQRAQLWSILLTLRDGGLKRLGRKRESPYPHLSE